MLKFFSKKKETKESLLDSSAERHTPHFHKLSVSDVRRETEDCVSVAFDLPSDLQDKYRFKPGQYLTLRTEIDGNDVRRSYSICSCPQDGELRVAIKRVDGGVFSTYANKTLKVGDELDVMTPIGNFTSEFVAGQTNQYVAIAAGSGITPIMSLIKTALQTEENSKFILIYGNRNSASVIFKDEIEDLKDKYMNRLEVHHVLSREDQGSDLMKGRIDAEKVEAFAEKFFDLDKTAGYFLCGPEEIIRASEKALSNLGVNKDLIHFELFTPAADSAKKVETNDTVEKKNVHSNVTVILDGDETHMEMDSKGKTILDSALDAGADVPFACKGAVCCTCRAKVLEGSAEMEMNYALTDEEVEEGYILTCQSHPTAEKVVVSFDE
ncbi:1,2-phenylacetyl-CoA epoxidase subunit PaaE [Phaeocystidibacter luteus]|uniref:Phenylacetate-CoA oxygenase/reductase subunit PaaK n=1 Tax=Phaeocystidibacter luteus TaxID=911197 RepID=A0A6N6RKI8_9FLAO|nr:1,2-phenylacetyl-CoA epoxidase subunit PaaE [Phaeocystidibacter luteus]KAB2810215.1 phenylacetate-CoA oxygenase/reductase subunit PaaK [Phaeocystidibacter luteus]